MRIILGSMRSVLKGKKWEYRIPHARSLGIRPDHMEWSRFNSLPGCVFRCWNELRYIESREK